MPIPAFTTTGDLPLGVHRASLQEVIARFGLAPAQRRAVALRLERVYNIARGTGALARFVIFGSFITEKPDPNDVDVFIVMEDRFQPGQLSEQAAELFDHLQADVQFGASVFWTKRSGLIGDEQSAIEHWQIKRDHSYRGIIEIIEERP
jgi:predicted nucleotidyltransferase